ncbi:uncharacterized protein [Venturia canescens]|uniref:uncharacterized protein n=1 Tax=Venturia canescens TaxID=32260 RepID=UPI001C9C2789|nr:uncharacterized protein LOC122406307 [Venturia canescens]
MKAPRKAPDGGWGWMVCLGSSLITFSLRALDPSFGLVFHDFLIDLDTDSTETSFITSVFDANMNFSGLFVGPLLKKFTFRKVAFAGAVISSIGLILTSRARSITHIVCTYSVLGGFGTGLAIAASFVALNTYFDKKRGQAVGFSMVGTAIAMMLMPQLAHILLDAYGFRGTMLIIGGWAMHSIIGSCLLRPMEYTIKCEKATTSRKIRKSGITELNNGNGETKKNPEAQELLKISLKTENHEVPKTEPLRNASIPNIDVVGIKGNKKDWFGSTLKTISNFLDLDLLKNTVYLNVIIGLSLFNVAETNFKLMTPFFLRSIGMTKGEIAFCLSLTAATDIVARLILPIIFDKVGAKKRRIFWISSLFVGIGRSTLAEQSKGIFLMAVLVFIGFIRGAVILNINLSVSECCSLKKLPHAYGLFMVSKGLFSLALSPLVGFVRDYSGSYRLCIHASTALITLTFISWTIEFSWKAIRQKKNRNSNEIETMSTIDKQLAFPGKMVEKKMVPPDGGWGWVVAAAYGLNNVIMVPILQGFSLVLKDVFKNLKIPATDATVILSVNSAFGMGVGLIHGPLLRKFGYRKIALLGSVIFTIGITATAFATTFPHFMITYGIMSSFGVALTMSAFSLAVNTYFETKRGRAIGMAMTFTGLGPILMPQLVSYLMSSYGTQGTIIILGGMTLHSLVGSLLLQPVKWHTTWQTLEPEDKPSSSIKGIELKDVKLVGSKEESILNENENEPEEIKSLANIDPITSKRNDFIRIRSKTLTNLEDHFKSGKQVSAYKWWSSGKSLEIMNLGSCTILFDEPIKFKTGMIDHDSRGERTSLMESQATSSKERSLLIDEKLPAKQTSKNSNVPEKPSEEKTDDSCWKIILRSIVNFFDLNLLRDPVYVNMMLGMSIAMFAEINFAILTPFILADMEFGTDKIAAVMSTLAGVDLVSRGLVPFIGEWLRLPARHMALLSLFLLICCRTVLIVTRNFAMVIMVAIGLGFAKGIRSVNMSLVIPNHIPIERLASATGIQMVVNGIVLMILGPLLGLSRDKFGSYVPGLIMINSTTSLTIIMWVTEMCIVRNKKIKERQSVHVVALEVR